MPRDITRQSPLGSLAARGFIIDEADDSYDAFPAARALGYCGISSKSCKGLYKSIVNATRAAKWSAGGERFFVTGEDLTCQAGLAVQQDLALGAFLGITHAERNGHHYVDGFGEAPAAEAEAFAAAHPDLYADAGQGIRLSIHNGDLLTGSLNRAGVLRRRSIRTGRHCACSNSQNHLGSNRYDHPTPRPYHERRHRPHGPEPASDSLDRRDPRAGRRPFEERRSRDA
ncbi:hypothetical protein ACVW1A_005190 [Bradyrhizobium sp. LB1.3]